MDQQASPLRIGVDGFNLALAEGTGVATYARALCHSLVAQGHPLDLIYDLRVSAKASPALRETLFYAKLVERAAVLKPSLRRTLRRAWPWPGPRDLVEVPREGRVIAPELSYRTPPSDRLFTRNAVFDSSARVFRRYGRFMTLRVPNPPALMHWTYPLPIRLEGAANVYTVHDLVPLRLPHTSLEDKSYYERLLRACVAQGDHVCTVSETSRADILHLLGADAAQVSVVGQPVEVGGQAPLGPDGLDAFLARLFNLRAGGYFLFFGAIEPKKNVGRLIQAFLESGAARPLVLVGREAWQAEGELRLLGGAHGGLPGAAAIRRIDFLPRALLLRLVQGARAVAFPSLYEGFGLPAAEAMSLGVPVLTSDRGASPEIVGDAALTVDPYDTAAIAAALRRLDGDDELCRSLALAGPRRMERFSQERFAALLAQVHDRAMAHAASGRAGSGRLGRAGRG